MSKPDLTPRRPGLWTSLAVTAAAGASAVAIALPTIAIADPVPPPPPAPTTAAAPTPPPAPPAPADPNAPAAPAAPAPPADPAAPAAPPAGAPPADPMAPAPAPAPAPPADPLAPAPAPVPPADPLAPAPAPAPAPADPNAPGAPPAPAPATQDLGRVNNAAGGFSYVVPAGWEVADASRLSYGQALLLKQTAPGINGQPAATANDTSILLGRLDLKLFAGAEADNTKAAARLASDMGEFFMPFPGTRINQQSGALQAADMPGSMSSYEVKFTDTAKPNGQIWAGVVGTAAANRNQPSNRWFVVWLGTGKDPIDAGAAKVLAESIRPYTPPAPPAAPAPDANAPEAPPAPGNRVGVPVPVETPVPEMMPAG